MKKKKIACATCKIDREVLPSLYSRIINGKSKGDCLQCDLVKRKTRTNTGQFQKGSVPHNKKHTKESKQEWSRLYKLKWRKKNREHVRKYFREYYTNHIDLLRPRSRFYKLRRRAIGDLPKNTIDMLVKDSMQNGIMMCYLCNKDCSAKWEIDHIVPIALKGTNEYSNLKIACQSCNRQKSSKTLEKYMQDVSMLI